MRIESEILKQIIKDMDCSCTDAVRFYRKGYRKASEVIDEFVERLKESLHKYEHRSQTDGVPFYQMNAESFVMK